MRPEAPVQDDKLRPWLGRTPAGWRLTPLGYLVEILGGSTPSKDNKAFWGGSIPWVSPKDMKFDVLKDSVDHVSEAALAKSSLQLIRPPAVLTVVRGMILAHTVPVAVTAAPVTLNQDMKALLPRRSVDPYFIAWALRAFQEGLLSLVEEAGHGTKRLRTDLWTKFVIPVPPQGTQRAIANFLDRKTAAIDALIEKKERLIALLQEKRQALITQAVTKGLDPTVPVKDSGVEWIGEIPAHWMVTRARFAARLESGHTPSRTHPEYWVPDECTIPWFSLADVWQLRGDRQDYVEETKEKVSERGLAHSAARLLPAGTVILSRTASVGFSGIMSVPMATTQDFVNWVCGPRISPEYLLFVFRAMRPEFRRLIMGSTHQTIYMPDVRSFQTPLPYRDEQERIVAYIRRETQGLDRLIRGNEQQVDNLREYRQALITSAVTGQLDIPPEENAA